MMNQRIVKTRNKTAINQKTMTRVTATRVVIRRMSPDNPRRVKTPRRVSSPARLQHRDNA